MVWIRSEIKIGVEIITTCDVVTVCSKYTLWTLSLTEQ